MNLTRPAHPASLTLPTLADSDQERLNVLFGLRGDIVAMARLRADKPLDLLAWIREPHIRPWHEAILAAFRENRAAETHRALSTALKDLTRVLDLEANSTLKVRAVNSIVKLANAILRPHSPPRGARGCGTSADNQPQTPTPDPAPESDNSPTHPRNEPSVEQLEEQALSDAFWVEQSAQRLLTHRTQLQAARRETNNQQARLDPTTPDPLAPTPTTDPSPPTTKSRRKQHTARPKRR